MSDGMFYGRSNKIGESGQTLADLHVKTRLGWIYRPQPFTDIGIDGEIEVIDESGRSAGVLAKVQVKSAASFPTDTDIKVPIDRKHLQYWQSLQLPVILMAVNLETETVYWLPIDSSLSIPLGQESATFRVPIRNVLSSSAKADIRIWLESAPKGVISNLLSLALNECDDIPVGQIPVGSPDLTDQESAALEVLKMVEKLEELFEGLLTHKDREDIGEVHRRLCEKRMLCIQNLLSSQSDGSAEGNVEIHVEYDAEEEHFTIRASGCISTGYDNDGNPSWSDDVNAETKGYWRGNDPREVLERAEADLCSLAAEWEEDRRRRAGDL